MKPKFKKKLSKQSSSPVARRRRAAAFVIIGALLLTGTIASLVLRNAPTAALRTGRTFDSAREPSEGRTESDTTISGNSGSADQSPAGGDFSGIQTTLDPALAAQNSGSHGNPEVHQVETVAVPLVLQSVDPDVMQITPEQQQTIERLRQRFVDMIGGPDQDPKNPDYLQRWQNAQPEINEELRAQLGQVFFQSYEMAAARTQLAGRQGSR